MCDRVEKYELKLAFSGRVPLAGTFKASLQTLVHIIHRETL